MKLAIAISIFGVISLQFVLHQSDRLQTDFLFTKPLIGSLYASLCVLGILAVFYPRRCGETFRIKTRSEMVKQSDVTNSSEKTRFEGHHPNCKEFSGNRIRIQKTVLCAACSGLFAGAVFALIGALLYFFFGAELFLPKSFFLLAVGNAGLLLGLIQTKFRAYAKAVVNGFFVFGSLVCLVVADSLASSLFVDLYVFALIIFFLLTRILISQWNNKKTCAKCRNCKLTLDWHQNMRRLPRAKQ